MLQTVLKVLGFLLALMLLENLLRGAIAVGLTIKICDSHIYVLDYNQKGRSTDPNILHPLNTMTQFDDSVSSHLKRNSTTIGKYLYRGTHSFYFIKAITI